jgi:hypothetical protein
MPQGMAEINTGFVWLRHRNYSTPKPRDIARSTDSIPADAEDNIAVAAWEACARQTAVEQKVARETGLEPAASGVTGRRSNRLSYSRAWDVSGGRTAPAVGEWRTKRGAKPSQATATRKIIDLGHAADVDHLSG